MNMSLSAKAPFLSDLLILIRIFLNRIFLLLYGTYVASFAGEHDIDRCSATQKRYEAEHKSRRSILKRFIHFALILPLIALIWFPSSSFGAINSLPWSTTFNCPEWDQASDGWDTINCDGLTAAVGDWYASGHGEQITTPANNPMGAGGRGQRHWMGEGGSGTAPGSGEIAYNFPSSSNVYMRFYFRLQSGMPINAIKYWKLIYAYGGGNSFYMDTEAGGLQISLYDRSNRHTGSYGLADAYGSTVSDGSWHAMEVHFDMANGIFEYWFYPNGVDDPTPKYRSTSVNYRMSALDLIKFPENHKTTSGSLPGGVMYADFDDIAISTTGRIGALGSGGGGSGGGGGGTTPPPTPVNTVANLRVFNPNTTPTGNGTLMVDESFESTNLAANGWYDNTNLTFSTSEHISGSTRSAQFTYNSGATTPTSGGAIRKKFTATDKLYVSYWVKYSSNWQGSNRSYQPHEFYVLTNKDSDWGGLASTVLTTYIEQNEGVPLVAIQDSQNIDESNINTNLTGVTEQRAVAGCNGDSDGYGNGSCYSAGSSHQNFKEWRAGGMYFQDSPGAFYKNDWHKVEVFLQLNSISNGQGVADGIVRYWYDGQLIIDHSDMMFRTGQNADMMFDKFIIGPFIGDGSPVTQTFWIDDLKIYDDMP